MHDGIARVVEGWEGEEGGMRACESVRLSR